MVIVGGAVLAPKIGLISQKSGSIAIAYSVPLAAYVFVALYAFWGAHLRPFAQRGHSTLITPIAGLRLMKLQCFDRWQPFSQASRARFRKLRRSAAVALSKIVDGRER
jgi:hypothetical protein